MKKSIPIKIKKLRELSNLKQKHFAEQLGISTPAYSNLENGHSEMTLSRLEKICEILQVDCIKLLETNIEDVVLLLNKKGKW